MWRISECLWYCLRWGGFRWQRTCTAPLLCARPCPGFFNWIQYSLVSIIFPTRIMHNCTYSIQAWDGSLGQWASSVEDQVDFKNWLQPFNKLTSTLQQSSASQMRACCWRTPAIQSATNHDSNILGIHAPPWGRGGGLPAGKSQNCTGQKCTEHELVLLMFFVLKCLDDLLWGFKMPLVGLLWLLVHHQINSVKNKMLKEVVKSAQSTSSCFCFDSYVGWPKPLLEL